MRLQNQKVLAGVALLMLLAAGTAPAFAEPAGANGQCKERCESTYRSLTGTIRSLVGEVVTLELEDGKTETFRISQQVIKLKGLVPGMRIGVDVQGGNLIAESVKVLPSVAVVEREQVRVERTVQREETRQQQRQVVTPAPVRRTERIERRQETRQQQRQVVTPAPVYTPAPVAEPVRPVRGLW